MIRWSSSQLALLALVILLSPAFAEAQTAAKQGVVLVYWSSRDCRWCTYWESSWSGMEDSLKSSDEFKILTYRVVKNDRIADPYTDSDYPSDLGWLKERVDRSEEKIPPRPGWSLYVNSVRIAAFYGTRNWTSKILPEIKRLATMYADKVEPGVAPDATGDATQRRLASP